MTSLSAKASCRSSCVSTVNPSLTLIATFFVITFADRVRVLGIDIFTETTVFPTPTPVTVPSLVTFAISSFSDDHLYVAFLNLFFKTKEILSPVLTVYDDLVNFGVFTITEHLNTIFFSEDFTTHITDVFPSLTPFTTPLLLTIATFLFFVDHFTCELFIFLVLNFCVIPFAIIT